MNDARLGRGYRKCQSLDKLSTKLVGSNSDLVL